jgi:hypothetical protein
VYIASIYPARINDLLQEGILRNTLVRSSSDVEASLLVDYHLWARLTRLALTVSTTSTTAVTVTVVVAVAIPATTSARTLFAHATYVTAAQKPRLTIIIDQLIVLIELSL